MSRSTQKMKAFQNSNSFLTRLQMFLKSSPKLISLVLRSQDIDKKHEDPRSSQDL